MNNPTYCPKCGTLVKKYSNPTPTADVVIYDEKRGIVLVRRSNEPLGLALPGGFVEEGESVARPTKTVVMVCWRISRGGSE